MKEWRLHDRADIRPESWDMSAVEDLQSLVEYYAARYPEAPFYFLCYSMGACVTMNWLAVHADDLARRCNGAVMFSPVFQHLQALEALERTWMPYNYGNGTIIRQTTKIPEMEALRYKPFSIGIRPYLETTIRHTGHDSVEELLEANYELSAKYISKIKTSTFCIYARDDPLGNADIMDRMFDMTHQSPYVTGLITKDGGHCGYFAGLWPVECWGDLAADAYFSHMCNGPPMVEE
jgi:predicted alpha/beta-fold hydrolase